MGLGATASTTRGIDAQAPFIPKIFPSTYRINVRNIIGFCRDYLTIPWLTKPRFTGYCIENDMIPPVDPCSTNRAFTRIFSNH
jgi:hypothetical protein